MNKPLQAELKKIYAYLSFAVILCMTVKIWEPGIGVSSATYGAFAKNIIDGQSPFRFYLSPGIFDPFVDHPPLIIWIQSLAFKLFGISAQVLRLPSLILGFGVFASLFFVAKNIFGLRAAIFSILSLLLINTFMNYTNSGWLDMGMIGFVWIGFCCLVLGQTSNSRVSNVCQIVGSFCLGLAILAKGLAAMALLPIAIFLFVTTKSKFRFFFLGIITCLPIILFSYLHYKENGFFFWSQYWARRTLNAAEMELLYGAEPSNKLWYLKELFSTAHLIFLLAFASIYFSFLNKKLPTSNSEADSNTTTTKGLIILSFSQILLHSIVYSFTNRDYSQYLLPAYPWIALLSGFTLSHIFQNISATKVAKRIFQFGLFIFVALGLSPIVVHSGTQNDYYKLVPAVKLLTGLAKVRVISTGMQHSWEGDASNIVWHWNKKVELISRDKAFEILSSNEGLAVNRATYLSNRPEKLVVCLEMEDLILFFNSSDCVRAQQVLIK